MFGLSSRDWKIGAAFSAATTLVIFAGKSIRGWLKSEKKEEKKEDQKTGTNG